MVLILSIATLKRKFGIIHIKANKGDKLLHKCIKDMLVVGDGAFKITFDESIDEVYPIIEFYPGENVEYTRVRGRITEVIFVTEYIDNKEKNTRSKSIMVTVI